MAIPMHSRYANNTVSKWVHPKKGPVICLDNYVAGPLPLSEAFNYTAIDGDTYESLAWRYYKDSSKWWIIAQANNGIDALFFPLTIPMGSVIKIPSPLVASQV